MGPLNFMTCWSARPSARWSRSTEDESVEQFAAPHRSAPDTRPDALPASCATAARTPARPTSPAGAEPGGLRSTSATTSARECRMAAGEPDELPPLDYAISESGLACKSCGACGRGLSGGQRADVRHPGYAPRSVMMASLCRAAGRFPAWSGCRTLGRTEDRLAWTAAPPFEVPTVEDNPEFEVLYRRLRGRVRPEGAGTPAPSPRSCTTRASTMPFWAVWSPARAIRRGARGNEYLFFEMVGQHRAVQGDYSGR